MKKIVSLFLCILMLAAAAVTVHADGVPKLTIRSGNSAPNLGETVDFTVSVDPIEGCRSGGIVLSYNSDVFELVSGQCVVSDAFMSDFTDGTGVFAFAEGKTVSGTVFRFTLRVKANAAFGDYTVSCKTNFRTDAGSVTVQVSGAKIKLECDHTFGNAIMINNVSHKRTCSKCGQIQEFKHQWDSGKVHKSPTCKEEGQIIYICTDCGFEKTESVAKTEDHRYGSVTSAGSDIHKQTCTVCGKEITAAHTWDKGKITQKPNCKETGIKTYTCTGCGSTRTENLHKTEEHAFTNNCDTTCNLCGLTRTAKHRYGSAWSNDRERHYHVCTVCGDKKDISAHVPGKAATETTPQLCTECGYVLQAALGHKHSFAEDLIFNEQGHWYPCEGCDERQLAEHEFENACDTDCGLCGFTRQTTHEYAPAMEQNADGHWHSCSICGEMTEVEAHIPGEAATEQTAQTCTQCGYELAPKLEPVQEPQEEVPEVTEPTAEAPQTNKRPLWIAVIVLVLMVGVIVCAVVLWKAGR